MRNQTPQSPERWSLPPSSFIKLNFNGASKGNPRPQCKGGVFKNSKGEILHIYTINLGHSTNNAAELNAMVNGLNISLHKGFHKLILEGDSNLVITIYNKLLNDTPPCKVSEIWHLSAIIECFPPPYAALTCFSHSIFSGKPTRWLATSQMLELKATSTSLVTVGITLETRN